jgi:hypothetical protein
MFDAAPFDAIQYDSAGGEIILLQSYVNCSTGISAVVNVYKRLAASVKGATQISLLLTIKKVLSAVFQSSTYFIADLGIKGKVFLNVIISTSTAFVGNLKVKKPLASAFASNTQVSSFVSVKKALQGSFTGQTIFVVVMKKGWSKVRQFTATWGRVK